VVSKQDNAIIDVAREERLRKLELMVLRGVTNTRDMSIAFGITKAQVGNDLQEIRKGWRDDRINVMGDVRDVREKQIEHIYFLSLQAFERSRIGREVTDRQKKVCTWCGGEGREEHTPDHWIECTNCDGEGQVEFESKRNADLPGDAIYLKTAKDMIVELLKLDGLYPMTGTARKTTVTSRQIGGEIQTAVEELYIDADPEVLMRAMRVMDDLNPNRQKNDLKIIEHLDPDKKVI
jgi:hypothetical protein